MSGYGELIADAVRTGAYEAALRKVVTPGATVVDLGAGTGILSLLACKLGASRVFAIEPGDAAIVGVELAKANGFADRIQFIGKRSTEAELPGKVDVIVSDLHGVLPLHTTHIPSVADARRRWLKPGGALIPRREYVRVQLVSDTLLHTKMLGAWAQREDGLDLRPALKWAAHQMRKVDVAKSRRIAEPRTLFELDYRTIETPDVAGEASWVLAEEDVTVHGIAAWFDSEFAEGVTLSNAPDKPRCIYGQMFFPLAEPLSLRRSDRVTLSIEAQLVAGEYLWAWNTRLVTADGQRDRTLRQSSFQAMPVNPQRLQRRVAGHRPVLAETGRAMLDALSLIEQGLSLAEIVDRIAIAHPTLLDGHRDRIREFVGDLVEEYSS